MKILVCIKEVVTEIKTFNEDGFIERGEGKTRLNKNDLYALEQALRLKEKGDTSVTALTMGGDSAISIIKEAFSMGVDNGFLLKDASFKGSDTISTARALVEAINYLGNFDLILLGEFSSESKAGVLGGMIGEKLNYDVIQNTSKIIEVENGNIIVSSSIDKNIYKIKDKLPVVLTVRESNDIPRFPNYIDFLRSEEKEIKEIVLNNLTRKNKEIYGSLGSDIVIDNIEKEEKLKDKISENKLNKEKEKMIHEGNTSELSEILVDKLQNLKLVL